MNIKIILYYYLTPNKNIKCVFKVLECTDREFDNGKYTEEINTFWNCYYHLYGKGYDIYLVPDYFQPELLIENQDK